MFVFGHPSGLIHLAPISAITLSADIRSRCNIVATARSGTGGTIGAGDCGAVQ
jgi:hypothetical protein